MEAGWGRSRPGGCAATEASGEPEQLHRLSSVSMSAGGKGTAGVIPKQSRPRRVPDRRTPPPVRLTDSVDVVRQADGELGKAFSFRGVSRQWSAGSWTSSPTPGDGAGAGAGSRPRRHEAGRSRAGSSRSTTAR